MSEFELVLNVISLFFLRLGIPLILLVIVGTLIDRWQRHLHRDETQHDLSS